jgi:hypothetical protein
VDVEYVGHGFTVPADEDYILNRVTFTLSSSNGDVRVELWDDNGGFPGSHITTIERVFINNYVQVDATFPPQPPRQYPSEAALAVFLPIASMFTPMPFTPMPHPLSIHAHVCITSPYRPPFTHHPQYAQFFLRHPPSLQGYVFNVSHCKLRKFNATADLNLLCNTSRQFSKIA